jgi:hypothetical protein
MHRLSLLAPALVAVLLLAPAASADTPRAVSMVVHVALAGSLQASTTHGTFASSGAIVDAGTEAGAGRFAGLGHLKTGEPNSLHSDLVLTSPNGTISIALDGLFGTLPAPLANGDGEWRLVDATGAYTGMHARGHWSALADFRAAFAHTGPPTVSFDLEGTAN